MEVFLSKPKKDKRSAAWTSACFHTTMNAQIQSERAVMSGMLQSTAENSELSRLYHLYKRCEAEPTALRQSAYALPLQVIMLVAGVAILILILITLITYICFVRRYKEHLRGKQKLMNG
ncbi:hypothetical protein OESDEN_22492 [Oesophagostomum dentatum]|uniref:Uncharacterized protein n=1 Tax=Oesophagostomum dentatum TaxID=61180 RepID=A0A0B1RXT9_OESDE|nr:hypothetical protein OESDEN_22492 [Oesophagostomum dentatum]